GRAFADTARGIVRAGIPVMGHVGLTPQSLNALGGWRVQGRSAPSARALLDDALALEDAGCFALVLESVPERVAAPVSERLRIPTIGIGAGASTSGQVLVLSDVLGLYDRFTPKFAKRYAELGQEIAAAASAYRAEVETRLFPAREHTYAIPEEEWRSFLAADHAPVQRVKGSGH